MDKVIHIIYKAHKKNIYVLRQYTCSNEKLAAFNIIPSRKLHRVLHKIFLYHNKT